MTIEAQVLQCRNVVDVVVLSLIGIVCNDHTRVSPLEMAELSALKMAKVLPLKMAEMSPLEMEESLPLEVAVMHHFELRCACWEMKMTVHHVLQMIYP